MKLFNTIKTTVFGSRLFTDSMATREAVTFDSPHPVSWAHKDVDGKYNATGPTIATLATVLNYSSNHNDVKMSEQEFKNNTVISNNLMMYNTNTFVVFYNSLKCIVIGVVGVLVIPFVLLYKVMKITFACTKSCASKCLSLLKSLKNGASDLLSRLYKKIIRK